MNYLAITPNKAFVVENEERVKEYLANGVQVFTAEYQESKRPWLEKVLLGEEREERTVVRDLAIEVTTKPEE